MAMMPDPSGASSVLLPVKELAILTVPATFSINPMVVPPLLFRKLFIPSDGFS
jgi:hypothetical protein